MPLDRSGLTPFKTVFATQPCFGASPFERPPRFDEAGNIQQLSRWGGRGFGWRRGHVSPECVWLRARRCLRLLDVSWLLRGEHSAGLVMVHRSLYTFQTRSDSIKRNGGLQEASIDLLTGVFLLLCAVSFGPCFAFVGLTSVLKPHSNEFNVPVPTGKHKHLMGQDTKNEATYNPISWARVLRSSLVI